MVWCRNRVLLAQEFIRFVGRIMNNEENLVSHDVLPIVIQKTLTSLFQGDIQWVSSFEVQDP